MNSASDTPWWHTLYDDNLAAMLLDNTDPCEVDDTINFLKVHLGLKPNHRVFDQCCGNGRLSLALAKDHQVLGIDLIDTYIHSAKVKAEQLHVDAEFRVADAFEYSLLQPADIAINWWTSFAYAEDDEVNIRMLQCALQSIKRQGLFALDFMNVPGIYRHFLKDVVTSVNYQGEELILLRKSTIDFARGRLLKEWRYFTKEGEKCAHHSDVSLYTPAQLLQMFNKVGFVDVQLYGDLSGGALSLDSPRCIVVGKKP